MNEDWNKKWYGFRAVTIKIQRPHCNMIISKQCTIFLKLIFNFVVGK
jgi:hypothetical protein